MVGSSYKVVGVMSGTSLDGIDLAECILDYSESDGWSYKIGVAETISYPNEWITQLREAVNYSEEHLHRINIDYTRYLGEVVNQFIEKHQLKDLDAVCSHGHTILHQPAKGITLQIGNLPEISRFIGEKVVCDFRVQDVALGGQGAPLVPIGDRLLFGAYDYCLNLGGFANVSSELDAQRIAYDVCPVNIVMNHYANHLGEEYDPGGSIARSGTVNEELLNKLNSLEYYGQPAPKSLGLEWVQQFVFPRLVASKLSPKDVLRTFVEHVVIQLASQFEKESAILVTGGGVYNSFLIERLKSQKDLNIIIPNHELIEYKEALVFALLGVLRIREEVNCLASVTGASRNHSGGEIYTP